MWIHSSCAGLGSRLREYRFLLSTTRVTGFTPSQEPRWLAACSFWADLDCFFSGMSFFTLFLQVHHPGIHASPLAGDHHAAGGFFVEMDGGGIRPADEGVGVAHFLEGRKAAE